MTDAPDPNAPRDPPEARIDATFRNGSMTVVGVLTAFSLGFLTQWSVDPKPWHRIDLAAVLPMVAGTVVQLLALKRLLHPDALRVSYYLRAIRLFLCGLVLLAAGVLIAVANDAITAI